MFFKIVENGRETLTWDEFTGGTFRFVSIRFCLDRVLTVDRQRPDLSSPSEHRSPTITGVVTGAEGGEEGRREVAGVDFFSFFLFFFYGF